MIIAADSSPLISFAIIDQLDILPKIFTDIYIPKAVYDEIIIWDKPHAIKLKVFAANRIKYIQNRIAVEILREDLDLGEAETIVLALELGVNEILIDENKGRKIARSNGLYTIGTIGTLLQAKKGGHIKYVKLFLDKLINNRIRISKELYMEALDIADENKTA